MRSQQRLSMGLAAILAVCVMTGVACNLGVVPATPTPLVPPTSSQKPTVSIQAPQNNADAVVGQPITVQATGSHPDGVTRLELRANTQQVDSKVSQNPLGDQQFSAYLNYTPTQTGTLILQVIAYHGNLASDAAAVTVNVKSQAAQVTATVDAPSGSDNTVFDPTCRARVEVNGLNFRQGPGQNYPPFQILGLGSIVIITGRLTDNSWWQGKVNNTVGWVSYSFVTLLGYCNNIPTVQAPASPVPSVTITNTTAPTAAQLTSTPGQPDLIVVDVSGPSSLILGADGTAKGTYKITVQNVGSVPAGQFNLGLVMPDGTQLDAGMVPALAVNQTAIFQQDVIFTAPGVSRIAANVDKNNTVVESNEANNLKALDIVIIKPTVAPTGTAPK